jgi:ABC-type cobalt transport system substrate-binding protein
MLYHALQTMDAKITVHLVFSLPYRADEDEEWEYCGESDDEAITAILPAGVTPKPQWSRPEGDVESLLKSRKARTPEELRAVEVNPNSTQFVKLSYAAYGNHPQRDTIYGSVCLIASRHPVKPPKGVYHFFGE